MQRKGGIGRLETRREGKKRASGARQAMSWAAGGRADGKRRRKLLLLLLLNSPHHCRTRARSAPRHCTPRSCCRGRGRGEEIPLVAKAPPQACDGGRGCGAPRAQLVPPSPLAAHQGAEGAVELVGGHVGGIQERAAEGIVAKADGEAVARAQKFCSSREEGSVAAKTAIE